MDKILMLEYKHIEFAGCETCNKYLLSQNDHEHACCNGPICGLMIKALGDGIFS